MTKEEVLIDTQKVVISLILKEPFFGHFLNNLNRKVVGDEHIVKTAAIMLDPRNNLLTLVVNVDFWNKECNIYDANTNKNAKYWLIKHELLHILFKHIFNWGRYSNKTMANIAVDLVVHQCIKLEYIPEKMRKSLALIENFPHFFPDSNTSYSGTDNHQTTDFYYKKFIEESRGISKILSEGESTGSDGESDGESKDGQGQGSGNSNSDNSNWGELNDSQQTLSQFMQGEQQGGHSTWDEINKLNKGNKEFANSWIDSTVSDVAKKLDRDDKEGTGKWRGTLPAGITKYLEELADSLAPSVNWSKQLRQFAANGESSNIEPTLKRRSKRYNTFPGTKIRTQCKILIAIDTSGSVDNESLAEFFSEMAWIYKASTEVLIVECDTQIGKIWPYKGKFPGEITGRGGTDFNAPIIYANEEYNPDCVIYFTDGEASPPVKCNCPIMWLISKNQGVEAEDMNAFQGIKIKMDF